MTHILLVEDNQGDARLIEEMLREGTGHSFHLERTDCLATGLERLRAGDPREAIQVVLLDLSLPDCTGLSTFEQVHACAPHLPIIVLTGMDDEALAIRAAQVGAQDYLIKGQIDGNLLTRAIRYAIERKRVEQSLRESEDRYALAARGANDGLWDWDLRAEAVYFSPRWKEMLGYAEGEIGNRPAEWFDRVVADDLVALQSCIRDHLADATVPFACEYRVRHRDGHCLWMLTRGLAVREESGRAYRLVGSQTDITQTVQALNQVRDSLREKEVLLKEIHHRVKNNLQIVSSLLSLQADLVRDQTSLEVLRESQNRIRSMALIHEKLYQSPDLARVNFADYVRVLAADLFRSYQTSASLIQLTMQTDEEIQFDIDIAIPCGLLVNELISNALKHAFPADWTARPNAGPCVIHIELSADQAGRVTLVVRDNGVGFPQGVDFRHTETLGLQLVMTLVEQLEGTIDLNSGGGSGFTVTFLSRAGTAKEGAHEGREA